MSQSRVQQEMKEVGFAAEDLGTLFCTLDSDGSGDVSLEECCEGFVKMKLSMRGVDRVVAYFRKAFAEADADGSGTLCMNEFKGLTKSARVLKRLAALGVSTEEVECMFERLSMMGPNRGADVGKLDGMSLTADDMISCFLAVREHGIVQSRGVNFLRRIFLEGDVDCSNSLTRPEMQKAFCTQRVSEGLRKLELKEPDWMGIFDALDCDGDGDLSWCELSQGMCMMWMHSSGPPDGQTRNPAKGNELAAVQGSQSQPHHTSVLVTGSVAAVVAATAMIESTGKSPQSGKLPRAASKEHAKVSFVTEEENDKKEIVKEGGLSVSTSATTMTPDASIQSLV